VMAPAGRKGLRAAGGSTAAGVACFPLRWGTAGPEMPAAVRNFAAVPGMAWIAERGRLTPGPTVSGRRLDTS
jgi:hypothetical protein